MIPKIYLSAIPLQLKSLRYFQEPYVFRLGPFFKVSSEEKSHGYEN
jgi:hypothetical protein